MEHAVFIQQKEVDWFRSASEQVRMLLFSLLTSLLGSRFSHVSLREKFRESCVCLDFSLPRYRCTVVFV